MEEIGCHFKLEQFSGRHYHKSNLLLSSGRNCLRYIINERKIETIFLPYFLCESLSEVATLENVEIRYYHIGSDMLPTGINKNELNEQVYLYFVNYYGLLQNQIDSMVEEYKYIIIDNTHDFLTKKIIKQM